MRKKAVIVYSWILLSVIAQVSIYTLIDKVYLGNRSNIVEGLNTKTIDTTASEEKIVSIDIPSGASNVSVSFDGSYISYILDNKLNIIDVKTQESKKVIDSYFLNNDNTQSKTQSKISSFKWVPYKNMIMFAMTSLPNASSRGQVYTFDLETGNIHVSKNIIYDIPRNGQISDIIISPLTMVYYIRVTSPQNNDRFYRVDIMDDIFTSVSLSSNSTVKIGFYTEDLYYTEGDQKILMKSGLKAPVSVSMPSKQAFLGIGGTSKDAKDVIYSGILNGDGKVEKIIYGNHATSVSEWKSIEVSKPIAPEELIIKDEGKVYSVGTDNTVTELSSDKKTSYKGKFIGVTDLQVVYQDGDKLYFKTIK